MDYDYYFQNEAKLRGSSESLSQEKLNTIFEQMKCVCKIIEGNSEGTGFFCRIPFPNIYNLCPVLITANHVLDGDKINKDKKILLKLNNREYTLLINDSRKIFTNKIMDSTIIEIKRSDNINIENFLEIDYNLFENIILDKNEIGNSIYILHYEFGKDIKYSSGNITEVQINFDKNKFFIMYTCSTEPGSSGGPIINLSNSKVIGIHKGYRRDLNWNYGILINFPINNFIEANIKTLNTQSSSQSEEEYEEKDNYLYDKNQSDKKSQNQKESNNNINPNPQVHEHPLNFFEDLNGLCNVCLQKIENIPGYKCNFCKIFLCLDCKSKIFFGKKNDIHEHNLILKYRNDWVCNICHFNFPSGKCLSFFCKQCNFYACNKCYLIDNIKPENPVNKNKNNPSIHNHPLIYIQNLDSQCKFCSTNINNSPGYECDTCDLILCLDCADRIFEKNRSDEFHNHNLKLIMKNHGWLCDECFTNYKNYASFCCRKCDYDLCYKCYFE